MIFTEAKSTLWITYSFNMYKLVCVHFTRMKFFIVGFKLLIFDEQATFVLFFKGIQILKTKK